MEPEAAPSTSEAPESLNELPTISIAILKTVRDAQQIHGLKHSDYQRYRRAGQSDGCSVVGGSLIDG